MRSQTATFLPYVVLSAQHFALSPEPDGCWKKPAVSGGASLGALGDRTDEASACLHSEGHYLQGMVVQTYASIAFILSVTTTAPWCTTIGTEIPRDPWYTQCHTQVVCFRPHRLSILATPRKCRLSIKSYRCTVSETSKHRHFTCAITQ